MRGDVDGLGFTLLQLPLESFNQRRVCDEVAARRADKPAWRSFAATGELPPARPELKRLFRKGVPPELRPAAWLAVSAAPLQPGLYESLLSAPPGASADDEASVRQIELDVPRTFSEHAWLRSEAARCRLRRLLTALARDSDAGYCQGWNFVVAFFMLVFKAEGDGGEAPLFALARHTLRTLVPPDLYGVDLRGLSAELRVLTSLLASKVPRVAAAIRVADGDAALFATDWFLCLFVTSLPADTAARVLDAFFCEGSKVLLRVALVLAHRAEPELAADGGFAPRSSLGSLGFRPRASAGGVPELAAALRHAASSCHDRDALMAAAFSPVAVGSMPSARLARLRAAAREEVDAERRERDALRKSPSR